MLLHVLQCGVTSIWFSYRWISVESAYALSSSASRSPADTLPRRGLKVRLVTIVHSRRGFGSWGKHKMLMHSLPPHKWVGMQKNLYCRFYEGAQRRILPFKAKRAMKGNLHLDSVTHLKKGCQRVPVCI